MGAAGQARLPVGRAVPDGRRVLHLPRLTRASHVHFLRIYFAFAAGYLLSYLYRTVNAVISPELLARSRAQSVVARPADQRVLPRRSRRCRCRSASCSTAIGPRRVEPVLLALAASGAALFAFAESLAGLALARALIGAGVCACLMAPLKAIATWYPRGAAGVVRRLDHGRRRHRRAGRRPCRSSSRCASRTGACVFVGLSVVTLVVALAIWWRVPDIAKPRDSGGLAAQFAGVRAVFAHPRFWWIAPLGALRHGLVHGDPGPVGGAVADGSRGRHARGARPITCSRWTR